jgi:hypothetical protein
LLSVVRGLEFAELNQFYQILYRPDLVREKLAGDPAGKVGEAAAKLDLAKLFESGRPPDVTFPNRKAEDESPTDLVNVEARIVDRGGGIGRAEWRINGVTVGVIDKPAISDDAATLTQTIALDSGENTVELVAYNGQNLVASVPAHVRINWTGSAPSAPPRLHVLAVGINNYWEGTLKLNYSVADAKSFAEGLKAAGEKLYDQVVVTEVLDDKATAQNLDKVFSDLAKTIRPRDVFVLYMAGHGVTRDGRYYFIPQDFKFQVGKPFSAMGIGQDRLQAWLAQIPAKKSVIVFDTCESGSLTTVQVASLRGGFEQMAAVGRLIQATGRTTLTAALDNQSAYEGYHGHGVFTYALLDALARGDKNGNGLIEVTELIDHVDGLVPEITFKNWAYRQTPRSLFQGTNFALARQLPSIAPAQGEDIIISTKPTHVTSELLQVFKEAGGKSAIVQQLPAYSTVTLVKTERGWVLIAKDGKALGYVSEAKLHKLN